MLENAIRTTYQLLFRAKYIRQYVFLETLLTLPLWILIAGGVGLFILRGFSTEATLAALLSHTFLMLAFSLLLLVVIALTPLQFYLQFRFKIAAMFNAYDMLSHRSTSLASAWERSSGKLWHLFTARYKAKFAALHLSLQQSREIRKTGRPLGGKIMLHDDFFVIPILLFEQKRPDEAARESAKLYTRDFGQLLRMQLGFELGIPFMVFLVATVMFIGTLLATLRFPPLAIFLPFALLLWLAVGAFWGLLQSYSRFLFLVVLYVIAKEDKVSLSPA